MTAESLSRRALLRALLAATVAGGVGSMVPRSARAESWADQLQALEKASGGRLGVHAFDSATQRSIAWRAEERFGMCSTFKLLLVAAVLREADARRLALDRVLHYTQKDMVSHAPVTGKHLAEGGMRIDALAEAAQTTSDNVAANLLIRHLGGPAKVTNLIRAMGDTQTRLDRYETTLNLVPDGEMRDTTTPLAMASTVTRLMTGNLLSRQARARLRSWMIATETGKHRIRAGLPADWIAGDKTGTASADSMPDKHNDVAVIWSADRAPVIVAAYLDASGHFESPRPEDDEVLANVGRIVARWMVQ
ncbi:MAG: class A beta-lactamase [Tahibacter sp.]